MSDSKTQKNEEMVSIKTIWPVILKSIQQQGLSFLILTGVVLYFHNQNAVLQAKIDKCTESRFDEDRAYKERFIRVMENLANK